MSTSLKYYFYNLFKTFSDNTVLNGICSGVCASIFSHPLDVFKIYKQRSQDFNSDIKSIGTKLLFRGYFKTLIRNVLVSSMLFPLYDLFSTLLPDSVVLASLFTATAVTVILHPIDVMRTRHISLNRNFSYYSVPLFRGLHLNLLKMCPSFVITMVITEFIKKKY